MKQAEKQKKTHGNKLSHLQEVKLVAILQVDHQFQDLLKLSESLMLPLLESNKPFPSLNQLEV